jgi:hypothetical protein
MDDPTLEPWITKPVLREIQKVLDQYPSEAVDDFNRELVRLEVRPATADENPWAPNSPEHEFCFVVEITEGLVGGPLGLMVEAQDRSLLVTDGGRILETKGVEVA